MARRPPPQQPEEPSPGEGSESYEGFVRGTVKKLFETGAAAPKAASAYINEQFAGWKNDFLGIFQLEIRRFFDRHELKARLSLRTVPELTFLADETAEKAERLLGALADAARSDARTKALRDDAEGGAASDDESE